MYIETYSTLKKMNNIFVYKMMSRLQELNKIIDDQVCNDTLVLLSDESLLDEYKKSNSVKNNIKILSDILKDNDIEQAKINKILNDYLPKLIPAGTKGVIRGNKFNEIIREYIKNLDKLDDEYFEICFEKKCKECPTEEIPDWYILQKSTGKVIIGMNQLDLWNGGHQINRGFKYVKNDKLNSENSKLLCVVCNKIELKNTTTKVYELFDIGISNKRLCYIKQLKHIIYNYFHIK